MDITIQNNLQEKHFVCFLDILGFKEYVKKEEKDQINLLNNLSELINRFEVSNERYEWNRLTSCEVKVTMISDSIIISCDQKTQDPFYNVMRHAVLLTEAFYELGFLTRGGFSFGPLIHLNRKNGIDEHNIIFGSAFHEAYEAESKIAKHPRIVFCKSINFDEIK